MNLSKAPYSIKKNKLRFLKGILMLLVSLTLTSGISDNASLQTPYATSVYEPTWESLDTHPLPEWYDDAKLGMFIDWGIFSVPGWAPREETGPMYPDWYLFSMYHRPATIDYHGENWGEDFERDEFISLFKGRKYDPKRLVSVAREAGVKYIVLFCKHHDGFCLWDSSYTGRDAANMGPRRDLVEPLVDECRKAGMKFGFYLSLEEYEYPVIDPSGQMRVRLWDGTANINTTVAYDEMIYNRRINGKIPVSDYVNDYLFPQAIEFVEKYDPDIYWPDGEWGGLPEYYNTREFVSYFYNQAEGRKEVAVNDRFGMGTWGQHGDFYISEYASITTDMEHKWEECRSIGQSYGYNREDTEENVLSPEELIHLFINVVARGGNLSLIVNLNEHGELSELQVTRLRALGEWLKVNGEAIYGTGTWEKFNEDNEQIFYTQKGKSVYAICLSLPEDELELTVPKPPPEVDITMLGVRKKLFWRYENGTLFIDLSDISPLSLPCKYAWSFKLTGLEE